LQNQVPRGSPKIRDQSSCYQLIGIARHGLHASVTQRKYVCHVNHTAPFLLWCVLSPSLTAQECFNLLNRNHSKANFEANSSSVYTIHILATIPSMLTMHRRVFYLSTSRSTWKTGTAKLVHGMSLAIVYLHERHIHDTSFDLWQIFLNTFIN
jgi:hypothetical protein